MKQMISEIQLASWNVCGLGDQHQVAAVKTWICRPYLHTDVICLQELQANSEAVEMNLKTIFPDGVVEMDATQEGRIGSAVIVSGT
jgi:exonuclease III